ncbi:MAG: hypothetical protein QOJ46_2154 [bacterium]|jgi:hypothetical protein
MTGRGRTELVVRYVVPALVAVAGVVILAFNHSIDGLEGAAMFVGAALAILLLNVLYRVGVTGDEERDREAEARDYLDEHGHWPDEEPAPPGR